MKTAQEIICENVPKVNILQLATCINNKPWSCNLHYVTDEDMNIYWLSTPERRHSKELEINPRASATILVHENTKAQDFVIGITVEGQVSKVDRSKYKTILTKYGKKHAINKTSVNLLKFLALVVSGKDQHVLYKLKPTQFVLFDTKHFPDNPRHEWSLE